MLGRRHDVVQCPVDPVADPDARLLRLDVDVAGPLADRLEDHAVDELDDRSFVDQLAETVEPQFLLGPLGFDVLDHGLQALVEGGVLVEHAQEAVVRDDRRLRVVPGGAADVVERHDVERVDHADLQLAVGQRQRNQLVASGEVLRQRQQHRLVGDEIVEVDEFHVELLRDRPGDVLLGADAHGDEHPAQAILARLLLRDGRGELLARDQPGVDQHLAEGLPAARGRRRLCPIGRLRPVALPAARDARPAGCRAHARAGSALVSNPVSTRYSCGHLTTTSSASGKRLVVANTGRASHTVTW